MLYSFATNDFYADDDGEVIVLWIRENAKTQLVSDIRPPVVYYFYIVQLLKLWEYVEICGNGLWSLAVRVEIHRSFFAVGWANSTRIFEDLSVSAFISVSLDSISSNKVANANLEKLNFFYEDSLNSESQISFV